MWLLLKQMPLLREPAIRRSLKHFPVIRHFRRSVMKTRRAYYRRFGEYQLRKTLAASVHRRIVIGAWDRYDAGWIPTQKDFLDLLHEEQWERFFKQNSIDAMLAEHVWEHITEEEGRTAARTCHKYLRPGGYLRVAVPDGLLPDPAYIELVKAGAQPDECKDGLGLISASVRQDGNGVDHKSLHTYRTLSNIFESTGFRVKLYEYFDEAGAFHYEDWDPRAGTIYRSKRFDPRNKDGKLSSVYPGSMNDYLCYSSIVLDAFKY